MTFEPMVLRPAQVGEVLGVSRSKAYELISAGVIPSIRIGGSVRVPLDSLKAWIEAQTDDGARSVLADRAGRAG